MSVKGDERRLGTTNMMKVMFVFGLPLPGSPLVSSLLYPSTRNEETLPHPSGEGRGVYGRSPSLLPLPSLLLSSPSSLLLPSSSSLSLALLSVDIKFSSNPHPGLQTSNPSRHSSISLANTESLVLWLHCLVGLLGIIVVPWNGRRCVS